MHRYDDEIKETKEQIRKRKAVAIHVFFLCLLVRVLSIFITAHLDIFLFVAQHDSFLKLFLCTVAAPLVIRFIIMVLTRVAFILFLFFLIVCCYVHSTPCYSLLFFLRLILLDPCFFSTLLSTARAWPVVTSTGVGVGRGGGASEAT